jgi:ABC-type multidrug transport system fused ATPase/permease subunit
MVQEWLGTTLGLLSAILAIVLVGVATQLDTSSGVVGAGLIAVMNFSNYIFHLVVNWTQLETSLGAISRLRDFNEGTKSENLPGEEIVPPPEWPEKGTVGIKGVTASYQ